MTNDEKKMSRRAARDRLSRQRRGRFRSHLRGYFFAGVLVTAPIGITFYISWLLIRWVDSKVTPLIPAHYNPETYLHVAVPGLGLVIVFIALTFIGWATAGFVGRLWTRLSEQILNRMPVIRSVYGAIKQITETIVKQQSSAFREVVLFEYPRRGSWALGFITGRTQGEVQNLTEDEVVNVFLPTTPNPTSGYLLFLPKKELVILSMTVEEGIKMIVSGGIVTPPDRRSEDRQQIKRVAAADGETKTIPHTRDPNSGNDEKSAAE